ncbi:unnamed protein product [Schistocephalus solidus]|uniref:Reverse transcriptase domain-containing protein n=1 Tax=Schistocephalus solidus TaxID=70667 RepID=A0A183SHC5_SCHSO|nr:unnamed protein product [Schistocephalus solidus]
MLSWGMLGKTNLKYNINELDFYYRYMDDIFFLADNTTEIDVLVRKFNSGRPSLKCSAESEVDNENAFLDVLLDKQEGKSIQLDTNHRVDPNEAFQVVTGLQPTSLRALANGC